MHLDRYYLPFTDHLLDEQGRNFTSWEEWYGPYAFNGDNYTAIQRIPLDDASFQSSLHFKFSHCPALNPPPPPFAVKNIVLVRLRGGYVPALWLLTGWPQLTDGMCTSTCAAFVNFMRSTAKVHAVAVGGRPAYGPMQIVGGTKG